MALYYHLGHITVAFSHNTHVAGDYWDVYYDYDNREGTHPDMFIVYKNDPAPNPPGGSPESSGDDFGSNNYGINQVIVTNNGVEFANDDGITYTYFEYQSSYPYFAIRTQLINTPDVNDMTLRSGAVVAATVGSSDGSITVYSSGTNTPMYFAIGNNQVFNLGTDSGVPALGYSYTFGSLSAGEYDITAKDSKGFYRQLRVTIPRKDISGQAAYGTKYYFRFTDLDHDPWRVNIKKRDFVDAATELIKVGSHPFILTSRSEGNNIDEIQTMPKEGKVTIIATSFGQFREIAEADDTMWLLEFYRDLTGTSLVWQGFISPDSYTEEMASPSNLHVSFSAFDRLGDLKDYEIVEEEFPNINNNLLPEEFRYLTIRKPINGNISELEIIHRCTQLIGNIQPYRLAVNMFEADHATNRSPLAQTYIDVSTYFKTKRTLTGDIKVDNSMNCQEVISAILKPYSAVMFSANGYWYIVNIQELSGATVPYFQYDTALAYSSTSSFSPRNQFKAANEADRYRWMGPQTITMDAIYNRLTVTLRNNLSINNIVKPFIKKVLKQFSLELEAFEGWAVNKPTDYYSSKAVLISTGTEEPEYAWVFTNGFSIDTYFFASNYMEFDSGDRFNFSIDISLNVLSLDSSEIDIPIPYVPLRWQLKVGDKWLDANNNWQDDEVVNQFFINEFRSSTTFKIDAPMYGNEVQELAFELRLYPCTIHNFDGYSTSVANMKTAIKAITGYNEGNRLAWKVGASDKNVDLRYHYYELRFDDSNDSPTSNARIRPDDYHSTTNPFMWYLISSWFYDHSPYNDIYGAKTESDFRKVVHEFKPNGNDFPESQTLRLIGSPQNKRNYDTELFHFDLSGQVNNDQYTITNYLKLSDGNSTTSWAFGGNDRTLQQHFIRWLKKLYSTTRYRMSGQFFTDIEVQPGLTVLYDPNDDSRILFLTGVEVDYASKQHSGELIEIDSDVLPDVDDFADSDWNTSDWS